MKRKSKRGTRNQMIIIAVIAVILIALAIGGIVLAKSMTKIKSITITPDFNEEELDINQDYSFSIQTDPSNVKLQSLECYTDSTAATFVISGDGKALLHTNSEGTITVNLKKGNTSSNSYTYNIVDFAARQAEEQAALDAAAEAEAAKEEIPEETVSENEPTTELIMTTDTVKIRATPSTDGEILSLCKKGDSFTRLESTEDGWSKIEFEGKEAYIKSDYVVVATEEEVQTAKEAAEKEAAEDAKREEEEEKKADEEKKAAEQKAAEQKAAEKAAQDKAAEDAKKIAAATPSNNEVVPAPAPETPAPAPAPAPTGGTVSYTDKNGATTTFTQAEWDYIMSYWAYTGQAEYFVHKHTCAELHALYNATH